MVEDSSPSIFVATPCYGGQASAHYIDSLLKLQRALDKAGVGLEVMLGGGDALIPRVRSVLATHFLENTKHTHLLFIDADIGFKPDSVLRLLHSGHDLVGGIYPVKRIDWEGIRRSIDAGAKDLEAASLAYVVQFLPDAATPKLLKKGFGEVTYVGTGFMMISRSALERVQAAHPELRARIGDVGGLSPRDVTMFFETMIDPRTKHYLSEDYAFCRRWRDLGERFTATSPAA